MGSAVPSVICYNVTTRFYSEKDDTMGTLDILRAAVYDKSVNNDNTSVANLDINAIVNAVQQDNTHTQFECLKVAAEHLSVHQIEAIFYAIVKSKGFFATQFDFNQISLILHERMKSLIESHPDMALLSPKRIIDRYTDVLALKDTKVLRLLLLEAIKDGDEATAMLLIRRNFAPHQIPREIEGENLLAIAHQLRLQDFIVEMYDYKIEPTCDQYTIMNKMSRVLLDIPGVSPHHASDLKTIFMEAFKESTPKDERKYISRELAQGMCYGFSAFWVYLVSKHREDAFNQMIDSVIHWNGEQSTLTEGLKNTLIEVFDNIFFLSWTGARQKMLRDNVSKKGLLAENMNLNIDVHELLNIIKPPSEPDIKKAYSFAFTMTEKELTSVLEKLIINDKMIRLRIGYSHWTGLIKQGNTYHYYDPNSQISFKPTTDLTEVVAAIKKSYVDYYHVKKTTSESQYGIGIFVYDEINSKEVTYPVREHLMQTILDQRPDKRASASKGCSFFKETADGISDRACQQAYAHVLDTINERKPKI